jgi:hypothetical protein
MDVSATGLRFASDVTLVLNELVAIEIEDQLVLGEIRHCHPEGEKFIGGVRRLHQVPRGEQNGEIGEYVSEMIEDLERRVMAGEERASRMLALEALDRIVGKSQADKPQGESASASPALVAQAVAAQPAASSVLSETTEKKSSWKVPLAAAAALVLAAAITFTVLQRNTSATPPPPPVAAITPIPIPPAVAAVPTPPPAPVKTVQVAANTVPAKVVPETPPVTSKPPVVAPKPQAQVATSTGTHHGRVTLLEKSWVSVAVDGKPAQSGKIWQKGETCEFNFSSKAILHIGYGAGVEISVDGKSVGPIGGTLRMVELNPEGKRFLPWQNEAPATASVQPTPGGR